MGCAASTGAVGPGSQPVAAQPPQQQPSSQPAPAAAPAAAASSEPHPHAETFDDVGPHDHPAQPPASHPAAPAPAPAPVIVSSNPHQQQEGGPPGLPSPLAAEPHSPPSQQEGKPRAAAAASAAGDDGSHAAAMPGSNSAAAEPAAAMEGPKPPPRTISAHEHSLKFHAARYNGVFTCDVCKAVNEGECYTCHPCEFDCCIVCLEKAAPGGEIASGPRDGSVAIVAHDHALHEFKNRYPEHGGAFKCDLCGTHGSGRSWSCPQEVCGFDCHPHCMLIAQRRG